MLIFFGLQTSDTQALFRYDGDLYFANAGTLEKRLVSAVADKPQLTAALLDIEGGEQIDTTGEEMPAHMSEWCKKAAIEFYITRPESTVTDVLEQTGLFGKMGPKHIYSIYQGALNTINEKYGERVDIVHPRRHIHVDKVEQ